MPRTLRTRLTFWYTLTLAVILAASGLFWYWHLGSNLREHLDEQLVQLAEGVLAMEQAQRSNQGDPSQPLSSECAAFDKLISRSGRGELVSIVSLAGTPRCRSFSLGPFDLPLSDDLIASAKSGEATIRSVESDSFGELRLLTYPLHYERRLVGMVQVGYATNEMHDTLRHLVWILLAFSPLTLISVALGGWLLAGRALAPVERLTRTMHDINAGNLDQKLEIKGRFEEINRLAETFNNMLARLDDSFARIKQFSGDASHELRTPLTILKGETEVALRWAKSDQEFRDTLASNMDEINRMERIIEDLLLLAKSEAGELKLESKPLSLSDLLQELYLQGRTLGEEKNLQIDLHLLVDTEITIRGDELRLRQMFLNLLSNAVKYTPEQGRIDIRLQTSPSAARVSICDSGIGMPATHLPHIFDRFYRIDEARNRSAGGAGLGLAIVKWIVAAHEGKIEVESEVNRGTKFHVSLPLAGPQQLHKVPFHPRPEDLSDQSADAV